MLFTLHVFSLDDISFFQNFQNVGENFFHALFGVYLRDSFGEHARLFFIALVNLFVKFRAALLYSVVFIRAALSRESAFRLYIEKQSNVRCLSGKELISSMKFFPKPLA